LPNAPKSDTAIASKGTKTHDVDPDQRPDQSIDAADRIEKPAQRKSKNIGGHDILCRQETHRQSRHGGDGGAEQRDRQGFPERHQIGWKRGPRIGRNHHQGDPAELVKTSEQPRRRKFEIDQPEYENA
jgi:hypothetical protein